MPCKIKLVSLEPDFYLFYLMDNKSNPRCAGLAKEEGDYLLSLVHNIQAGRGTELNPKGARSRGEEDEVG